MSKIVIAAGGTGGHIFPAEAVAEKLIDEKVEVLFLTDERFFKYKPKLAKWQRVIPVKRFGKSLFKWPALFLANLKSFLLSFKLLREFKPAAVISFGGYVVAPVLLSAKILGIKIIIYESNLIMGRANRLFSYGANKIITAFPLAHKFRFSSIPAGIPVRKQVITAKKPYKINQKKTKLLIIGGSQGATIMAKAVAAALIALPKELRSSLEIIQQTRQEQLEQLTTKYKQAGIKAKLSPFFENIGELMTEADLIISRAGASSIGELLALARPSILLPYPNATDNHQHYNAKLLADQNSAWLVEEKNNPDLTTELKILLEEILLHKDILLEKSENASKLFEKYHKQDIFSASNLLTP